MVEGNIASLGLFLMILTIGLGLLMINMIGSVNASCYNRLNTTTDSNQTYIDVVNQYNKCKTSGFDNWLYLVFLTPFGVFLALIVKKLAII